MAARRSVFASARLWSGRDRLAVALGIVLPVAVCAVLVPFRTSLPNTDAALVLVAVVVAVASFGHRPAGVLASVVAAVSFDFLLTAPYETLSITDRHDVETFVLVVLVGLAVTELAVRGRLSRLRATTDEQHLAAIRSVRTAVDAGLGRAELAARVASTLTELLGLRSCRFDGSRFGGLPRLEPDGRVSVGDGWWDVDQYGLPDTELEILAVDRGTAQGRFVLLPTPGAAPSLAARQCAAVVVELAAPALGATRVRSR